MVNADKLFTEHTWNTLSIPIQLYASLVETDGRTLRATAGADSSATLAWAYGDETTEAVGAAFEAIASGGAWARDGAAAVAPGRRS